MWTHTLGRMLQEKEIFICFDKHWINKKRITIIGHCPKKGCQRKYTIKGTIEKDVLTKMEVTGTQKCAHPFIKRPLKGQERKQMGEMLKNTSVTEYYFHETSKGNRPHLADVLRKAKSETKMGKRYSNDDIIDLVSMSRGDEEGKQMKKITIFPLEIHSHGQLSYQLCKRLKQESSRLVLHVDATGSVVRWKGKQFYYAGEYFILLSFPPSTRPIGWCQWSLISNRMSYFSFVTTEGQI